MPSIALRLGSGSIVALGSEIGRGGEGTIFEIIQNDLCAKIYHAPPSQSRIEKLQLMASLNTSALSSVASWPTDMIFNHKGQVVGLAMPRISGKKDIHKLYSPKSRRQDFLRADWRFLIHASANIARAFAEIHSAGCVIGDVNHGSVLVAQDARVTLIDCDSFQLVSGSKAYLCEVGVENYLPPELQPPRSLKGIVRTVDQDNFGLAVMIFHLLMMGRHPLLVVTLELEK